MAWWRRQVSPSCFRTEGSGYGRGGGGHRVKVREKRGAAGGSLGGAPGKGKARGVTAGECLSDIAMTETSKSILEDGGVSISPLQNEKSRTSQDLDGLLTVLLFSATVCELFFSDCMLSGKTFYSVYMVPRTTVCSVVTETPRD